VRASIFSEPERDSLTPQAPTNYLYDYKSAISLSTNFRAELFYINTQSVIGIFADFERLNFSS
jgi:hypothetical protein